MCSEQLECFLISSSTMSFGSWNQKFSQILDNIFVYFLNHLFVTIRHPVYFKKTSAAPFGNRSPQLRGAWVCTWADPQNHKGGAAPPHQTETRWTKKQKCLCLSAPLVKSPHFGRLLCWMGLARYSRNYSGCLKYHPLCSDWIVLCSWSHIHNVYRRTMFGIGIFHHVGIFWDVVIDTLCLCI